MKETAKPLDFPSELGKDITFLTRQRNKYMNEMLKDYSLVGSMYSIVLYTHNHPGTTQDGIVTNLFIEKCTVTRRTKKLESLGYLIRKIDDIDHRQNNLFLTESGEKLIPVIRKHLIDWSSSISVNLSDSEKDLLILILDNLINTIKNF
jgi:DNA-binding MarR family transcriptional regulator